MCDYVAEASSRMQHYKNRNTQSDGAIVTGFPDRELHSSKTKHHISGGGEKFRSKRTGLVETRPSQDVSSRSTVKVALPPNPISKRPEKKLASCSAPD